MDVYEHLNVNECQIKAIEAGRAAHMIRNYLQGFTGLNHPEFACLDTLTGKIEANLRSFRAKLQKQKDLKGKLQKIGKSVRFIKRVISADQLEDNSLEGKAITEVRALVGEIDTLVIALDQEVNASAIKKFCKDFNAKLPPFTLTPYTGGDIMERYCPAVTQGHLKVESRFTFEEWKTQLRRLACLMSNRAHQTQDEVAEFVGARVERHQANRVINVAGQIENKARAVIKVLNGNPQGKIRKISRKLSKVSEHVALLRQLIEGPNFSMEAKKGILLKHCQEQMQLADLAHKIALNLA